jgi:hypothetical protein
MGRGYLLFTRELLARSLHLPDETEIYGADWDFALDAVRLYIMSPKLADYPEGARPPQVSYSVEYTSRLTTNKDDPYVEWHKESDKLR